MQRNDIRLCSAHDAAFVRNFDIALHPGGLAAVKESIGLRHRFLSPLAALAAGVFVDSLEGNILDQLLAAHADWQAGLSPAARATLQRVLAGDIPCYVLGRNCNSATMADALPLAGVLDDAARPGETWRGLPVIPVAEVPDGAAIVNGVLHRRPLQALRRLAAVGRGTVALSYADFTRLAPERFRLLPFVAESRQALHERQAGFRRVASLLADAVSQRTFRDVMLYRLTGDAAFMNAYSLRDEDQYFDLPVHLPPQPVFVDGGAYCGETSALFCRHFPAHGAIHVFEPNDASLAQAKAMLAGVPDVHFHPFALGDAAGELAFDAGAANASRIAAEGATRVRVMPVDGVVRGRIDFIKFDLEGYETRALAGCRRSIEKWHPALAICVYHQAADFVDVPEAVLAMRGDYRLHLRHYTEGWEESVMYFVPVKATAA